MTAGLLILAVFLVAAALMFFRVLPAMLALPVMAAAIAGIEVAAGRIGLDDLTRAVLADGALRLSEAMVAVILGGVLSSLMQKAGVAESIVRKGAELSGDNPWTVALVMLAVSTVLFTTVSGLGPVIMLGTIVLPILASIGVREHVASGVLLFGIALGGLLNAGNWTMYRSVLGVGQDVVSAYAVSLFGIAAAGGVGFVTVEMWRTRAVRFGRGAPVTALIGVGLVAALVAGLFVLSRYGVDVKRMARLSVTATGLALCGLVAWRAATGPRREPLVHWSAYAIPLVPLGLIVAFGVPFVAAFLGGIVYAVLATCRRGSLNLTSRAVIEGTASVAPALALMVGIGMLLSTQFRNYGDVFSTLTRPAVRCRSPRVGPAVDADRRA
jgi:hypothetical protein